MMTKNEAIVGGLIAVLVAVVVALSQPTTPTPGPGSAAPVEQTTPIGTDPVEVLDASEVSVPESSPVNLATDPTEAPPIENLAGIPFAEEFVSVGERYGLSPFFLAALASCETDFIARTSSAGATGVMQILPATAGDLNRWYGTDLDPEIPVEGIELAAIYTIESIRRFDNGDPAVLARAYNAGWGAIERDLTIQAETARHMDCVPGRMDPDVLRAHMNGTTS
ncbi:MAG: transglycosylase SLT domain-containing protein [Actinomycetota bacterium]